MIYLEFLEEWGVGVRQAGDSQGQKARGNLGPRDGIIHQTVSRHQWLIKSSWDPGQLTSTRRVAVRDQLPRGDTWHT